MEVNSLIALLISAEIILYWMLMRVGVDMHVLQGIYQGSRTYLSMLYGNRNINSSAYEHYFYFNKNFPIPDYFSKNYQCGKLSGSKFSRIGYSSAFASRRDSLDIFHFQYIVPFFLSSKVLVTVHDLLFETHPQYFEKSFVYRSRLLIRNSVNRADRVLTVSEYSKRMLIQLYGVDDAKVGVVSNGVCLDHFSIDPIISKKYVLDKYGVEDYILNVGRIEPRKNHKTLLDAYSRMLLMGIDLPRLVIVGQCDFDYLDVFEYIKFLGLSDHVVYIGDSNYYDILRIYRSARLFVYPSCAEGFGIPPLEAMAAGVPVVCSNNTAMSDLYSGAAYMVDCFNSEEIADAILTILRSPDLSGRLISSGYELAKRYTWDSSALAMLEQYREVF